MSADGDWLLKKNIYKNIPAKKNPPGLSWLLRSLPRVSPSSAKPQIRAGNGRAPSQPGFDQRRSRLRGFVGRVYILGFIVWDFNLLGSPERWEPASPPRGRGAGLAGVVPVGGKGAAAPGCSYPSSGIFPEGNRNRVLKQPVPSIVGSIRGLFSIPVVLFWDVSLHPARFAQAIPNPLPSHRSPARDGGSHKTTREHHRALGNLILMVAHAHLGECWVTYGLVDKSLISFQGIAASGASNSAGHSTRDAGQRPPWSVEGREGGSVFLCPFPRERTSPHKRAARQNADLAYPDICTAMGKSSSGPEGSLPFLTSTGKRAPAVLQARGRVRLLSRLRRRPGLGGVAGTWRGYGRQRGGPWPCGQGGSTGPMRAPLRRGAQQGARCEEKAGGRGMRRGGGAALPPSPQSRPHQHGGAARPPASPNRATSRRARP